MVPRLAAAELRLRSAPPIRLRILPRAKHSPAPRIPPPADLSAFAEVLSGEPAVAPAGNISAQGASDARSAPGVGRIRDQRWKAEQSCAKEAQSRPATPVPTPVRQ